jgi:hypothetical protein
VNVGAAKAATERSTVQQKSFTAVEVCSREMDVPPAPALELEIKTNPSPPPQSAARRFFAKALLGTAISGVVARIGHPWVTGEKQEELIAGVNSLLARMQERRVSRPHPPLASAQKPLPLQLDGEGRDYEDFLAGLGLRHIQPMEMIRPHFKMRGSICNRLPPRECWRNITPTLRVADKLREQLGTKLLTILSAYRTPAYNAACPGAATHSYHVRNMALDLAFDCPPAEVVKAAEVLREKGFFNGGIGRYPGFTHIDTRGFMADWG